MRNEEIETLREGLVAILETGLLLAHAARIVAEILLALAKRLERKARLVVFLYPLRG
jgi:hypothetical protein